MPVKSLHKVQKHISKKKNGRPAATLHENSRDAHRLQRASDREAKISRLTAVRQKLNQPYLERMSFFHAALQFHESATFTPPEIQNLVSTFIRRTDSELTELRTSRRPGRPPTGREDLLNQTQEAEMREYRAGFWVPNLEDAENVKMLKEWNGDWAALAKLKYLRLAEDGGLKESSFPPKGLS